MFLKRVEMQGFKSFADKTVISFDDPITGIVGPNGCGKSNITDAVRWVLGEQSSRQMRGEKMSDVIFSGSADRRQVNMAEVTLVFDNTGRVLNSSQDEIEVTRRLYRDSGDAEYLINRNRVRLKDVVDLFLDTGLGKDSLSIISQGNIISFAEAKPQDRRGIFEEAAGVSKYKKRKLESISRLARTKENLERSTDILNELEKQVSPLKRQARKAEIYREKKKRLEEIEIAVLVQDIEELTAQAEDAKKTIFDIETRTAMCSTQIEISETRMSEQKKLAMDLDREISALQGELMQIVDEISSLESRKAEIDERRKYIIETGNREEKIKEIRELLETARLEYEDRKQRLSAIQTAMQLDSEKFRMLSSQEFDSKSVWNEAQLVLRQLENRINYLSNVLKDPVARQAGTKAIMENRSALRGIKGMVGQEIHAVEGYENAISEALGGAMYSIMTEDEGCARDAINFLKRNQSGRVTFLPLSVIQPRYVNRDALVICNSTKGYLGLASDFVTYDPIFEPAVKSLLGNIVVVENMEVGNRLSGLTKHSLQIVTLDGEIIHRGGSMTGGRNRQNATPITVQREYETCKGKIDAQRAKVELAERSYDKLIKEKEALSEAMTSNRLMEAKLESIVDVKYGKYEKLKADLALLQPMQEVENGEGLSNDDTIGRLNKAYSRRDEVTSLIKTKRDQKQAVQSDVERKEQQTRQLRREYERNVAAGNAIKIDQGRLETKIENALSRLATEYQLTFEFARTRVNDTKVENAKEEVLQLRSDIEKLGNINMNAPEEYNEVNDRYEFLKKSIAELTESRDKILAAIDEMDRVMTRQFKEMFDKINSEFNMIFCSLYGGGKAKLILEDPSDILNTGIDIDAQPPGKAVQNNMLFSGGEKSLIALCVLFAILKVKPVPLVILDEVEAALDQGNVERFAKYLKTFKEQTQFLVVTHRPGTMENCDVLYGVTMQHQGVSQMLRVELKEAVDLADPSAKENRA